MPLTQLQLVAIAVVGFVGLVAGTQLLARRRRERRDSATLAGNVEKKLHLPASLHPVIDPDVCIGSLACLKVCPEGDILGLVGGVSKLVEPTHCIGHGRCALECPVGAIKLVFGTAERGVDLPEVDEHFESARPGVHVVGELGGMGLIKNAVTQGLQCAARLAAVLPAPSPEIFDVAIVGAGPAGIAAALGLKHAGRNAVLLEQGNLGGTVANYPRQKVVMTEKLDLPLYGKFGKKLISKEELLATFQDIVQKAALPVRTGVKVTGVEGQDGDFQVLTDQGAVRARKVVLAIGRRGTPRKLGAAGEDAPKVTYSLTEPEQYDGCKVLVVGGGDAALEAAIQLAEQSEAEVAISYRGEAFARCREANRQKIDALVAKGDVRAVMSSTVTAIRPDAVDLTTAAGPLTLANDFVIVNVGGELPLEFLAKNGIGVRRHFGEEPGKKAARSLHAGMAKERQERRKGRRIVGFYLALALLILGYLAYVGVDYYRLPRLERLHAPEHARLKPGGSWGHGVGIVATAFMLSNFLYMARKRLRAMTVLGPIKQWLNFHTFVGFMSPLVIAFHAAFQSNNGLATATAASLLVVVLTGIVGRFIYGLVPTASGKALEQAEVVRRWERLRDRLAPLVEHSKDPAALKGLLEAATHKIEGGVLALLFSLPGAMVMPRLRLVGARGLLPDRDAWEDFRGAFLRLHKLRLQVSFYRVLKGLMRGWRIFHTTLAFFLVLAIAAHIGVSLYLGYGWRR